VRWMQDKDGKADHYKDIVKLKWFDQFLRNHYLDEINRDVMDHIGATKKAEASASTANRYLALLRAILRRARDDWEWIELIPRVRLFPEPKKRVRWITQAQAANLVSELPPHLAAMAAFTLATGLRQADVSYLRWDQVDLKRRTAWIHADQSKSRRAIAVLTQQSSQHPVFVFTYKDAPPARTTTKAWKRALARAGIENFRWHDLRHTWASWHVQTGTSLQELMELGGWSSFEMVLRYAHLASEHLRDAAKRVDGTKLTQCHLKDGLKLIVNN
jgi:integrase